MSQFDEYPRHALTEYERSEMDRVPDWYGQDTDPEPAERCCECGATEPLTWHELCRKPSADPAKRWDYGPGWRCVDRRGCEERKNNAW
jgi:hypothetical protein